MSLLVLVGSLYFLPYLGIQGVCPDGWVLFTLYYAFRVDWKRAPLLALAVGLFKDLMSLRPFGIEIFSLGCVTLILSYVLGKLDREEPVIQVTAVVLFSLLYEVLRTVSLGFLGGFEILPSDVAVRPLGVALYTLVAYPAAFFLFDVVAEGPRRSIFGARSR